MPAKESFRVQVTKDYLKFSSAHFIAYPGFRERLHGHNYRVSVAAEGSLGTQGYVVDFGVVKKIARKLCERLDERVLVPAESDCMRVERRDGKIHLEYEGDRFEFPAGDAILLPIVHSSAEELGRYLAHELKSELAAQGIESLNWIEVGVEESFGQAAIYRLECG